MIGPTLDFTDRPPDEHARRGGLPVCRIVQLGGKGIQPQGFATGFMISPRLLLTNHHVFPKPQEAVGIGANFGYERGVGGINEGEIFDLDPTGYFISSEPLDFALVAVKHLSQSGQNLDKFGYHKLIAAVGKVLIGQPIDIVQHPEGGTKKYTVMQNKLLDVLDSFLHYQTDTLPGSSGSPAFSEFWEVVALHHSGVPDMRDGRILNRQGEIWNGVSEEDINWVANEGIRVSRLLNFLRGINFTDPIKQTLHRSIFDAPPSSVMEPMQSPNKGAPFIELMETPMTDLNSFITITGNTTINIGKGSPPNLQMPESKESFLLTLEKKIIFDPNYANRRGYDRKFLSGHVVPMPTVVKGRKGELLSDRYENPIILDYHHYSLTLNLKRRLQMWSAVNVDYSPEVKPGIGRKELGEDDWQPDPRVPVSLQLADEEFYSPARKFDRGHIVRREDSAWGTTPEELSYANADTFHWTNCTPQHEAFNRSNLAGIWGLLENHITNQANSVSNKFIIFGGPVLDNETDPTHNWGGGIVQIPVDFWKVIIVAEDDGTAFGRLRAYGFMLEQTSTIRDKGLEKFEVGRFDTHQRSLAEITSATGVEFDTVLVKADVMNGTGAESRGSRKKIEKLEDLKHKPNSSSPKS